MIEQLSNAITFYAFYVASGTGKTGLTVTIDVYEATTGTPIVSGGSATALGGGLYYYTLASGSVDNVGEYIAIFKTADSTVDQKELPAIWTIGRAGIEHLDADISSRAAPGAQMAITAVASAALVDEVWDEPLTGATHNVATSSGRRIRTMDSNVILSDVLPDQTGLATNAIKFDGGASSDNGAYDPAMVVILDGAGAGQCRLIYQYNGSTKTAYVDRDWKVQPTTGATFAIIADPGREHVNEGLAQGGGTNTITLNTNASSHDDDYLGQIVFLRGGTGADQASHVIAYNGTTKVATISKDWATQPDATTTYVMLPSGMLYLAGLVNDIWSAGTRTLTSGGGGASAQDVWSYNSRTLTQAAIAPQASISAGNLIGVRGDTISLSVTSLGSLANYSALYFTAKTDFGLPDAESTLQIVKKPGGSDGLLWLNAAATTSSWGSITITDANAGNITIALTADASKELAVNLYNYDIQIVRSAGTPVSTLATGRLSIIEDVTRSIA